MSDNKNNAHSIEMEKVLSMQESYFDNLVELCLHFENSGQYQKAFEIYQRSVEKAEKVKSILQETYWDSWIKFLES